MIGLSVAGFDPSGGAGILADIKTFSSLGIHGTGVVTSLTAQNPKQFFSSLPITVEYVKEQFDSVLGEYNINYGKAGMLYSKEIIEVVYKKFKEYNIGYIVDPVMVASSGGKLTEKNVLNSVKHFLKDALLLTPNTSEAESLSKIAINTLDDGIEASTKIAKYSDVLITGGHFNGKSILNIGGEVEIIENELINTNNTHGSGCTLSAAITSYLIKGYDLKIAILKANDFVKLAIENGWYGTLNQQF
ncbi:bifunctional hydroxymethylpyrimidine kinase/phosphomethylpyrimidine kinase [Methanobrevibacter filiformis]|uniref:Hydroxymethylpyrimidine/phosphomethylpyrimidine kinase n=1 Tax=Methanobrevibacter filiformis TaxID=55758 RepID=A0A165Z9W4_9EURY|nr:bifunctional hydroxymethylpyrimidine kinase/phosphomethylpyrimidine kinase [Methanobrevibacter filiformis]KZX10451.1 hydroxymethylpyrimidine/phosphomethylpyrimidine kinase [Methanobrevibacter filiformis]